MKLNFNNLGKKMGLLFSMVAFPLSLISQDGEGDTLYFSLDEARLYAVENNLLAENSRLDVSSADQRIREALSIGLPQIDGAVNYNYNINLATTVIPDFLGDPSDKIEVQFGTKHYATAGIIGSQLIFSGQYIVGLQTAKIYKDFTRKNLQKTEQEVRKTVVQNYYLVLLGKNTLQALQGNKVNIQKIYDETVQLYRAGFVEEIDVDQLAVTLTGLQNSVLSMERQVTASKNLLKYQMGLDSGTEIVLTDNLDDLVSRVDLEVAIMAQMDMNDNIDYQLLQMQEQLALMDVKLKQTDYMPTLSAFYSLDYTAQRDAFNFFDGDESWYNSSMVGLSFNVPIFSSGLRRAGVSQKKIAFQQAQNSKLFASEGLKVEFLQARYDFANALEKYRIEEQNLEVSNKVVSTTEIKYREGISSSLELTQVNDQYLTALGNYVSAQVELLNSKIKIDELLNTL